MRISKAHHTNIDHWTEYRIGEMEEKAGLPDPDFKHFCNISGEDAYVYSLSKRLKALNERMLATEMTDLKNDLNEWWNGPNPEEYDHNEHEPEYKEERLS